MSKKLTEQESELLIKREKLVLKSLEDIQKIFVRRRLTITEIVYIMEELKRGAFNYRDAKFFEEMRKRGKTAPALAEDRAYS